ncbi:glutaredoxin 3 [Novosphingobium sp. Gsoil 351]|nr:glutaredoxin 3 [Novosphingobium sp. Gsoil 351]
MCDSPPRFQEAFLHSYESDEMSDSGSDPTVEIYTSAWCGFCHRAKALLDAKGVAYREYDVTMGGPAKQTMLSRANGRTTVPQIFIGGVHVGGSDDLAALDESGKLDMLLGR